MLGTGSSGRRKASGTIPTVAKKGSVASPKEATKGGTSLTAGGAPKGSKNSSQLKGPVVQYGGYSGARDSGNDRKRIPFSNGRQEKEYKKLHRIPSHQSVFDRSQNAEQVGASGAAKARHGGGGSAGTTASPSASRGQGASSQAQRRKILKQKGDEDVLDLFRSKLTASTFRYLNGMIYGSTNAFAKQLLSDPATFADYHKGYGLQLVQWPMNPNALILESLLKDKRGRFLQNKKKALPGRIPANWVIADMGCGEAMVAQELRKQQCPNPVHSFDFVAQNPFVTVADSASVPLDSNSVDVCIFSLSLMATDYIESLYEAFRILKPKRLLKIVEVRSRVPHPSSFAQLVEGIGFDTDFYDVVGDYFIAYDFIKRGDVAEANRNPTHDPGDVLVPSLYKKR